jgi:hypothetical protein
MSFFGLLTQAKEQMFKPADRAASIKKMRTPEDARRSDADMNIHEFKGIPQQPLGFVTNGFVTFSPLDANEVLNTAQFDSQRKVDAKHVSVLADIMRRNGWHAKDKIDFARVNGKLILINGYHRMNAQVVSAEDIEWTVVIHECKSMDEVRQLYYQFDTNTRTRSASQILDALDFAESRGLSKQVAAALFRAVPVIASGFKIGPKERDILTTRVVDRRISKAEEYVKAAQLYDKCLRGIPSQVKAKFIVGATAAVALTTLRYQPMLAESFWAGAAKNDGLRKGDPRLAFFNDMMARARNSGSAHQAAFTASYAWNAWFDNREIKIIKMPRNPVVSISGTPFEV